MKTDINSAITDTVETEQRCAIAVRPIAKSIFRQAPQFSPPNLPSSQHFSIRSFCVQFFKLLLRLVHGLFQRGLYITIMYVFIVSLVWLYFQSVVASHISLIDDRYK
jgi:hypothetical protein